MVDKILDNIAVLLLEIIGYISTPIYFSIAVCFLIPGLFNSFLLFSEVNSLILIIGIYSLGYILRAVSNWIGGTKFLAVKKNIIEEIEKTEIFKLVKSEFAQKISLEEDKISYSDVRNMEMSKHPEIADKAYLFMFRSNLFLDILVINLIVSIFVILFYLVYLILTICYNIALPLELVPTNSIIVLMITILSFKPLFNARKFFFRISYSIPITHYLVAPYELNKGIKISILV